MLRMLALAKLILSAVGRGDSEIVDTLRLLPDKFDDIGRRWQMEHVAVHDNEFT